MYGERWQRYKWITILHHHYPDTLVRWQSYLLRKGLGRNGNHNFMFPLVIKCQVPLNSFSAPMNLIILRQKAFPFVNFKTFLVLFFFLKDVVKKIEGVQTGQNDRPVQKVEITQSGVIDVPTPFEVAKEGVNV